MCQSGSNPTSIVGYQPYEEVALPRCPRFPDSLPCLKMGGSLTEGVMGRFCLVLSRSGYAPYVGVLYPLL
jgi:hypothetical protein